jgi:hypothetical protein
MTTGVSPWQAAGGGAQCANYGYTNYNGRYRGSLYFTSMAGQQAAQFYAPVSPNISLYYAENCQLVAPLAGGTLTLPKDEYIGLSVYVPTNNVVPNSSGQTNIGEFHFQNVGGQPPIALMFHNDNVQAFINTGAYNSATGTFQYAARGSVQRIPKTYAIPPGSLTPGAWNDIVFHAHWAADSTGAFQFYYKAAGATTWQAGSSLSGIPTISWAAGRAPYANYIDAVGNYGAAFNTPYSVYLSHVLDGTSLPAVTSAMP